MQAFGLPEPNAGSDSTAMETRAKRDGDEYVINGQKIWTSRLDVSDYMLLMARTTPRDEVEKTVMRCLMNIGSRSRCGSISAVRSTIPSH